MIKDIGCDFCYSNSELSSSKTVTELFRHLVLLFKNIFGEDTYYSIWIVDKLNKCLQLAMESISKGASVAPQFSIVPIGLGVVGSSIKEKKLIIVEDALESNLPLAKDFIRNADIHSLVAFPLISGHQEVGAILLAKSNYFNWREYEDVFRKYSHTIGRFFENTRLRQESIFLHEIARRCAHNNLNQSNFITDLNIFLSEYFNSNNCTIYTWNDRDRDYTRLGSNMNKDHFYKNPSMSKLINYAFGVKVPIRLNYINNKDMYDWFTSTNEFQKDLYEHLGNKDLNINFLFVPIHSVNERLRLLGAIILIRNPAASSFYPYEEELLIAVSHQLTPILKLEEIVENRNYQLHALTDLPGEIEGQTRLELFGTLLDIALKLTKAHSGFIGLSNESTRLFEIKSQIGMDADLPMQKYKLDAGVIGEAYTQQRTVIKSSQSVIEEQASNKNESVISEIAVPLIDDKMIIGVIKLHGINGNIFDEQDGELVQHLASIYLMAAKQYERERGRVRVLLDSLKSFQACDVDSLERIDEALNAILYEACPQFDAVEAFFASISINELYRIEASTWEIPESDVQQIIEWCSSVAVDRQNVVVDSPFFLLKSINGLSSKKNLIYKQNIKDTGSCFIGFIGIPTDRLKDNDIIELSGTFGEVLGATYTRFVVNRHESLMKRAIDNFNISQQLDIVSLGFGHEARNVINEIMAIVDVVLEDPSDYSIETLVDALGATRLLIDELSDLSKRFLGVKRSQEKGYIFLSDVIDLYITLLKKVCKDANVTVEKELSDNLRGRKKQFKNNTIYIDSGNLGQILTNLVSNAIAAKSGPSGKIEIRTKTGTPENKSGKWAVLEVSDYGKGIDKSEQNKIWSAGYTTTPGGYGLGLHIVRRLVLQNDGVISLFSRLNHGTTFQISFPIIRRQN